MIPNNSPAPPKRPGRLALTLDTSKGASASDSAASDINTIIAQFKRSGTLPNVNRPNALFGDFTAPTDIHSMREICFEAEDRFQQLPADVRSLADNDMARFVDMYTDPESRKELEAAGLLPSDIITDTNPLLTTPEPSPNDNMPPSSPPASDTDTP